MECVPGPPPDRPVAELMSRTPATAFLDRQGIPYSLRPYPHVAGSRDFGREAARALGVAPERVLKTLVTEVDETLVVAVLPVTADVDLKGLASAVGGKRARLAAAERAERVTGYVVGGISPFGQRRRLDTVLDASALEHDSVLVSAGRRGLDVELTPGALVAATSAFVAGIGRGSAP